VQGIYSGTGGAISTIVAPGSAIPNGTGNFTAYNVNFRYDGGSVVFVGAGTGQSGVYGSNGSTITRVADLNTMIPAGTGNFTSFSPFPAISGGVVSFAGAGTGQSGVYSTGTGSLGVVADLNTGAPGATGNFTGFGANPSVSNTAAGILTVFRASSSLGANAGIYQRTNSSTISLVADVNTPVPGGGMNFSAPFFEPTISGLNISFIDSNGVYARIGGVLTTIANTLTPSPNGTGNFTAITAYAPISGTSIAFIGNTATSKGIYLYSGGQLFTLLDNTNPTFDGKTLGATPFFLGPDAISGNQVAFGVSFSGPTSSGIYLATFTPAPEPSSLALMGIATALATWRRRVTSSRGRAGPLEPRAAARSDPGPI
jgi:hypothetical protein